MSRGFVGNHLLLGLFLILGLGSAYLWLGKTTASVPVRLSLSPGLISPTPTPVLWKTYTNTKYKFQMTYPASGMLWAEDAYQAGECGSAIKEGARQSNRILTSFVKEVIQFDSFFEILVLQGPKTIDEYISEVGGKGQYDLFSFADTGADEAVEVVGLKKGAEYAVGYPPLAYISHIFRKGDELFLVKHFFDPHNLGGCVDPALLDPVAHSHLKIKSWDLKQSFKFTP